MLRKTAYDLKICFAPIIRHLLQAGLSHFPSPSVAGEGGGVPVEARRDSRLLPVAEIVRKVRPRQTPLEGRHDKMTLGLYRIQ